MADDLASRGAPGEATLWIGRTSQWVNVWFYALCLVIAGAAIGGMPFTAGLSGVALIIPVVMWGMRWWTTRTTEYEITSQRLRIRRGILNRRLEEIELYRVKDYVMDQPLAMRMIGLGNLAVVSSDPSAGRIELRAIPAVERVREQLRNAVQTERDRKRVREVDFDDLTHPM